jgi:pyruvate dehydrogenase E2 component (dihydrolipoamide acetyltransferase)
MNGGTFTITNLGSFGIDGFNPIINYPESAILGIGRIVEKVISVDGDIRIEPRSVLSLTHDHRVIDGAPAAGFIRDIVRNIEEPHLSLLE